MTWRFGSGGGGMKTASRATQKKLRERGESVVNHTDMMRRWSEGDRIFVGHEMDEEAPSEALNFTDLAAYTVDQMIALPVGRKVSTRSTLRVRTRPSGDPLR